MWAEIRTQEGRRLRMEAGIRVVLPEPKDARSSRSCRKEEGFSPRAFGGSTALLTPWFRIPSLQND